MSCPADRQHLPTPPSHDGAAHDADHRAAGAAAARSGGRPGPLRRRQRQPADRRARPPPAAALGHRGAAEAPTMRRGGTPRQAVRGGARGVSRALRGPAGVRGRVPPGPHQVRLRVRAAGRHPGQHQQHQHRGHQPQHHRGGAQQHHQQKHGRSEL
ncbi:hypothetical protein FOCC_FOCC008379, partial [Frankliniella occidentalis]